MNSIFDKFLTVQHCDYYANQVAKKLNLKTYSYYWDNSSQTQIPSSSNILNWGVLKSYEPWRIKFNLTKPKTIMKMGLEEYVSKNHELRFNLAIKGFSILYVIQFYNPSDDGSINAVIDTNTHNLYSEDKVTGQYSFVF